MAILSCFITVSFQALSLDFYISLFTKMYHVTLFMHECKVMDKLLRIVQFCIQMFMTQNIRTLWNNHSISGCIWIISGPQI